MHAVHCFFVVTLLSMRRKGAWHTPGGGAILYRLFHVSKFLPSFESLWGVCVGVCVGVYAVSFSCASTMKKGKVRMIYKHTLH